MKIYLNKYIIILLACTVFLSCKPVILEDILLTNLRCEMLVNTEGIDSRNPRLSWEISGNRRNIIQTAYKVIVASTAEKLAIDEGDLWNSGIVKSDQSVHVSYAGEFLKSRKKCYWKVKVWSNNGESKWSQPAYWSMGLLNYVDWKGRWIGADHAFPWDREEKHSRLSARYYRKEFESDGEIKRATLYIMGLGLYELYINGQRTGDQVLAPSPTDYTRSVRYNTFNVSEQLKTGKNAIGVILGNGRYYTMKQNFKPYKIKNFGYPKLLLNLYIEYKDGTSCSIQTDNTWKFTADGPIRSNNEYDGEIYDARKEMTGWNAPGFDDSLWLNAEYAQPPRGEYMAQMNENMKVMHKLSPVSIKQIKPGVYILDMGQNMTGWLKIRARGSRGNSITIRFAESLQENGELFTANLRDAQATDTYILKGDDMETWEPSFVYHGFRYAEISGYPGTPSVYDFTGQVVYDNMRSTGTFETSDSTLNQIYRNAWWSISGNYKGMPVDCPQRDERQPWLGDRSEGCYGESFMFDNASLYAKWLDDIHQAQKADGSIPDVAPAYFNYYSDNMTWPGTYIQGAQMLYYQYRDKKIVSKHYPAMKRWLQYMKNRYMTMDYIVTKDSYGDWCAPPVTIEAGHNKSSNVKKPSALISTAYYYYFTTVMMEFAELLGEKDDYNYFNDLGINIKNAFHKAYYNDQQASYHDSSLTFNLLPLYFGIVPEKHQEDLIKTVVDMIEIRNQGHLSTGLIGTQWLMRSLTEYGRPDLAFTIATQRTYPGWGYMVENGATTIWELWNGNTAAPNMNSQNHVMLLGDLIIWFYENLAGIKTDTKEPGFKKIKMKPELIEGLDYVKASYHSIHGLIKSAWIKENKRFTWNITIPGNTRAVIYIPALSNKDITEGGEKVTSANGIKFIRMEAGRAVFEIGSGDFLFESEM